jgi:hypothetical protein
MSLIRIGEITVKPTRLTNTGVPYYSFSGTLDTNIYTDITSNKNWMEVGKNHYDFLFCRNQVMTWTAVNGFNNLSEEEKEIASSIFAVGKTERDSIHTEEQQMGNWQDFIEKSQESRELRWKAAKAYISYVLSPIDGLDIAKSTNTLSDDYIIYGIEDFNSDGLPGLFDWLDGTSSYSGGTGFSGKSYWVQEYEDNILKILRDGIY